MCDVWKAAKPLLDRVNVRLIARAIGGSIQIEQTLAKSGTEHSLGLWLQREKHMCPR
jgi:hypothetical protein